MRSQWGQRTFSRAAATERGGGEPEQPLAPEYHDKSGASSYQQGNQKKQRDDMKRDGARAKTREHDRAPSYHDYTALIYGLLGRKSVDIDFHSKTDTIETGLWLSPAISYPSVH